MAQEANNHMYVTKTVTGFYEKLDKIALIISEKDYLANKYKYRRVQSGFYALRKYGIDGYYCKPDDIVKLIERSIKLTPDGRESINDERIFKDLIHFFKYLYVQEEEKTSAVAEDVTEKVSFFYKKLDELAKLVYIKNNRDKVVKYRYLRIEKGFNALLNKYEISSPNSYTIQEVARLIEARAIDADFYGRENIKNEAVFRDLEVFFEYF